VITNTGKAIIAKYLIGQAPAYASYMAFGSGPRPKESDYDFTEQDYASFAQKPCMDFELFRTPITSRGFVTEVVDGVPVSKVALTAELPPDQRYGITEIGIYSARSNPSAVGRDSRMLYTFTESENWQYHNETTSSGLGPVVVEPPYLDTGGSTVSDIINPEIRDNPAFMISSNNILFGSETRVSRQEGGRYLNTMVMVPGDMSHLEFDAGSLRVKPTSTEYHGTHIHQAGITINLEQYSSEDLIKTAFSVINKNGDSLSSPTKVWILIEFASSDSARPSNYARLPITVSDTQLGLNRYVVNTQPISSLQTSENFSWSDVNVVKIYATAFELSGIAPNQQEVPSENFYIGFDGMRVENISSQNPLYGLTAYSILKSENSEVLFKEANSSNLVEFRLGLDVA